MTEQLASMPSVEAPAENDEGVSRRGILSNPLKAAFIALGGAALAACDFTSSPYDRNVHLLRRLTFGPSSPELARIRAMGESAWLAEQLNPATINTSAIDAKIAGLTSLAMTYSEMALAYPTTAPNPGWQLQFASVIRSVESPAQLFERMVEFWNDHFNIYFEDRRHQFYKIVEDREVIRRYALGKFSDLLVASAQSPAMLLYLDNYISNVGAINENYSREVLELHTVGVEGGYTEEDVVNLARLLTGWGITSATGQFTFRIARHDTAPLTIMGWTRPSDTNYMSHGVQFLQWLALRPETARNVCTKIARRFVADNPERALIDAMAEAWALNGSAIIPVLQAMVGHPSFTASAGKKYRRPSDFLAFVMRAARSTIAVPAASSDLNLFNNLYGSLNQIPFLWDAPNGYPDDEISWLSAGGNLARWNLAGGILLHTIPQFTIPSGVTDTMRAACEGRSAPEIYDVISMAVMQEKTTDVGKKLLNAQLGWSNTSRPTSSQIALAISTIMLGIICSVDGNYR